MKRITEAEQRREYTLERVKAGRPEVIDEVLRLRGQWLSIKKIAKLCNVSVETVVAICGQYADQLKNDHARRVQTLRTAADQLIEEILANPNNVPWSVKASSACALYDKSELLSGRVTERIEIKEDIFASFPEFLRELEEEFEARRSSEEQEIKEQNPVRPLASINASMNGAEMGCTAGKNCPANPPLALPEGSPEKEANP
jgi:hypothetical protein